jgi:hypothetical protein
MFKTDIVGKNLSNEYFLKNISPVNLPTKSDFSQLKYSKMNLTFHGLGAGHLDFSFDNDMWNNLLKGDVYYGHSVLWESELASPEGEELIKIFSILGMENFIHNSRITYPIYSAMKYVYVLPKIKGDLFTRALICNPDYISKTKDGVVNLHVYENEKKDVSYIVAEKKIFMFQNATVEMSVRDPFVTFMNEDARNPYPLKRYASVSDLTSTDAGNKYIKGIRSLTIYQDLPNDAGVLVLNYSVGILDSYLKTGLSWALSAARSFGQDKAGFEAETASSITHNLNYFLMP